MEEYKNSTDFKDEVNEAVCDAYHKDFKEYMKKIAQAFHLLDLGEIKIDEPKEIAKGGPTRGQSEVDETPRSEATILPHEGLQSDTIIEVVVWPALVQETISQVNAETRAMINATVEAFKSSGAFIPNPNS